MFDLLEILEKSGRTIRDDLERWFKPYPAGAAYYLVSDYCLNDAGKQHDVYAFEIILKHDTPEAIARYIRAVAPKDLKKTRKASEGLGQYLVCPVTFSVSFVVAKDGHALREYASAEVISAFIPAARDLIAQWVANNPDHAAYFLRLDRQLHQLSTEMNRKKRNERLIRQIFLVATFAAHVLELLDAVKAPTSIQWISDRDAMFDRYDGLAFDLAFLIWLVSRTSKSAAPAPVPKLAFALPGMDDVNDYEEFIRLPDYLAGTLADVSMPDLQFSHVKFAPLFTQVFVNSSNNAVVQIVAEREGVTTRRLGFGARRSAWQPLQPGQWKGGDPHDNSAQNVID